MKTINASVLMSVWNGDDPSYFKEAFESINKQSVKANEFLLIQDGEINKELLSVIETYQEILGLKVIKSDKNLGLAKALNLGLNQAKYELIIRMDSDDICHEKRFERLFEFMSKNQDISVCGSWVTRFDKERKLGIYKKISDPKSIHRACRYRNPVAHPSVIYRKSHISKVGNYPHLNKCQDWGLWSLLLKEGYKITNLQESLLDYRASGLYDRRQISYYLEELKAIRFQYEINFLNYFEYILSSSFRILFRIPYLILHFLEGAINRHK
tara:strand:+ start:322 stop:1128 length:807 start_codon:yes stop_codon:yes gene_type:complete